MRITIGRKGEFIYPCKCGREVIASASALVVGEKDYCGCGRLQLINNREVVNQHRRLAGLPEIGE